MAIESIIIAVLSVALKGFDQDTIAAIGRVVGALIERLAGGEDPAVVLAETNIRAEFMNLDAVDARLKHEVLDRTN